MCGQYALPFFLVFGWSTFVRDSESRTRTLQVQNSNLIDAGAAESAGAERPRGLTTARWLAAGERWCAGNASSVRFMQRGGAPPQARASTILKRGALSYTVSSWLHCKQRSAYLTQLVTRCEDRLKTSAFSRESLFISVQLLVHELIFRYN
jgi:hypothetical protein